MKPRNLILLPFGTLTIDVFAVELPHAEPFPATRHERKSGNRNDAFLRKIVENNKGYSRDFGKFEIKEPQ